MEVNGITKDLAIQYREVGIPQPGQILVEKDDVVCSLPAQQVFNFFGASATWNPDQKVDGYKIPFVCIAQGSEKGSETSHGPLNSRQGSAGNGRQRANTTYAAPPISTKPEVPSQLQGLRSQHGDNYKGRKMPPQPQRGVNKLGRKGKSAFKLTPREKEAIEEAAFGEGPRFNQRQPTKSGYGDRSTTYPQGHASSRHSGASQSTARPGKGAASGGTNRPRDRSPVHEPDKGPHRGRREPLTENFSREVKSDRYSTPNAPHTGRGFSGSNDHYNNSSTSMPPQSSNGLLGYKPYLNANNANTGSWLPR